jgi:hypothetical protein
MLPIGTGVRLKQMTEHHTILTHISTAHTLALSFLRLIFPLFPFHGVDFAHVLSVLLYFTHVHCGSTDREDTLFSMSSCTELTLLRTVYEEKLFGPFGIAQDQVYVRIIVGLRVLGEGWGWDWVEGLGVGDRGLRIGMEGGGEGRQTGMKPRVGG